MISTPILNIQLSQQINDSQLNDKNGGQYSYQNPFSLFSGNNNIVSRSDVLSGISIPSARNLSNKVIKRKLTVKNIGKTRNAQERISQEALRFIGVSEQLYKKIQKLETQRFLNCFYILICTVICEEILFYRRGLLE